MKEEDVKNTAYLKCLMLGTFLMLLAACGTNKISGNDLESGKIADLINNREFEIEHEWVNPLGGNRINLIGNANYIRMRGDSVDIFLPYFGVRHTGGYGTEGGIKYKGPAKNYDITRNEKRNSYMLRFDGNHESENLGFLITIHSNGNANTSVNSSQRNSITYIGKLGPLEEN